MTYRAWPRNGRWHVRWLRPIGAWHASDPICGLEPGLHRCEFFDTQHAAMTYATNLTDHR